MIVKAHYNLETSEVIGYYPDFNDYNSIPEPNIEISEEEWHTSLCKKMKVVDGVLSELNS